MSNPFISAYNFGDRVKLHLHDAGIIDEVVIDAVKFTSDGKVFYDVLVQVEPDSYITIKDIDSVFLEPLEIKQA